MVEGSIEYLSVLFLLSMFGSLKFMEIFDSRLLVDLFQLTPSSVMCLNSVFYQQFMLNIIHTLYCGLTVSVQLVEAQSEVRMRCTHSLQSKML